MESKEYYTPQEIVQLAEAYHRVKSASLNANPLIEGNGVGVYHFENTHLPEFERDVPAKCTYRNERHF
ncbi:MAG: hypothetical protein KJ600_00270 [Nanoarchaeota archaeon]|nr:hypothetical protein [Nanoarchaeota archaeon]MBU1102980.1 hypothetical protein [Nanoarchaeota archaeon]